MLSTTSLVVLSLASFSHASGFTAAPPLQYPSTCGRIASTISSYSQVFYPNSTQYIVDNEHFFLSSTQASECSVEPGSVEDVSKILSILGSTRTPFGVKGGGHIANPGFSSTSGVEISMTRFNTIKLDSATGTVDVGSGVTWFQAYEALNSTGFNIIGGRAPTVGVSGLTLGGGYSFLSNQYGLTIDNMAAYELVLPNGTITTVTSSDKDLWFALRVSDLKPDREHFAETAYPLGGGNNFGIVTKFTFKAIPLGQIWGGVLVYTADQLDLVKEALVKFQKKNDTKASLNVGLSYSPAGFISVATIFYNAPTPAPGIFDDFLAIPTNQSNLKTRSLGNMVYSLDGNPSPVRQFRGFMNGIMVSRYSLSVIDTFVNQILFWGRELSGLDPTFAISATMEPFASSLFSHGSDSAYPPDRSQAVFPTVVYFTFRNASLDETIAKAMRNLSNTVTAAAIADGQHLTHAAACPNFALYDTPLEDMYGANLPRLRAIKKAIDPKNVMGLAGGFKL